MKCSENDCLYNEGSFCPHVKCIAREEDESDTKEGLKALKEIRNGKYALVPFDDVKKEFGI